MINNNNKNNNNNNNNNIEPLTRQKKYFACCCYIAVIDDDDENDNNNNNNNEGVKPDPDAKYRFLQNGNGPIHHYVKRFYYYRYFLIIWPVLYFCTVLVVGSHNLNSNVTQAQAIIYGVIVGLIGTWILTMPTCFSFDRVQIAPLIYMTGGILLSIICGTCGGLLGTAIEGYTFYSTIPTLNNAQYKDLYLSHKYNAFYVSPGIADYDMNRVGVYKIDNGYSTDTDGDNYGRKLKDNYYYAVPLIPINNNNNENTNPNNIQGTIWVVNHATSLSTPTNNRMFDGGLFLGTLTTAYEDIDNYLNAIRSVDSTSTPKILYRNKDAKEKMIGYRNSLVEVVIAAGVFTVVWLLSIATYEKHRVYFAS